MFYGDKNNYKYGKILLASKSNLSCTVPQALHLVSSFVIIQFLWFVKTKLGQVTLWDNLHALLKALKYLCPALPAEKQFFLCGFTWCSTALCP